MSLHDNEDEDGVEEGECPFMVHGLTEAQYETKTEAELKARAIRHFNDNKAVLSVGHHRDPESMWNNPDLYPKMFPWLFPYGLGGVGTSKLSGKNHKRFLLMYHNKRFQIDPTFPFVAFSHEQIKSGTTGGFLLAKKSTFSDISKRFTNLNRDVLDNLISRLEKNEHVVPQSEEEKMCFRVIRDLDHIAGKVDRSTTSKMNMRREIWSFISKTAHA
ncbi:hypothetical protein HGRIS_000552 [Hohenbuehelia grisea]|uniref:Uncharacterized protein n=1 Tax=Hohenbuehelia grisea TaxID=104357 RepID=A0ABR3JRJ4_9AGAR